MHKDWFFPGRLALRIASDGVANREVAYFMLANFLFGWVIFYGAFTWSNQPWTLLSLFECFLVVVVTIYGFINCFDAAGAEDNKNFAAHFSCLSFGVWFWTTIVSWSIFWSGDWLLRQGIFAAYNYERFELAESLATIGVEFSWLWTSLVIVGGQIAFFKWLAAALRKANPGSGAASMN